MVQLLGLVADPEVGRGLFQGMFMLALSHHLRSNLIFGCSIRIIFCVINEPRVSR